MDGHESQEIFITLTPENLKELKDTIDRAMIKEKTLKEF